MDEDEDLQSFEEDEVVNTGSAEREVVEPKLPEEAPTSTGRVVWHHIISRVGVAILAVLLVIVLVLKPKEISGGKMI